MLLRLRLVFLAVTLLSLTGCLNSSLTGPDSTKLRVGIPPLSPPDARRQLRFRS